LHKLKFLHKIYEQVSHWYQNKISEMHQTKLILNYLHKIIKMSYMELPSGVMLHVEFV